MTRARALKSVIRARIAKTGERYTTARRHVLAARTPMRIVPSRAAVAPVTPPSAKGSLSDANARARTGHGLDHWFDLLDRFGAVEKGHTAAARYLRDAHGVDGWHSQGITVAYERARGLRAVNQRLDGRYEVSVSKTVAAEPPAVIAAFAAPRRRSQWLGRVTPAASKALAAALARPKATSFTVKPNGLAQYRFPWGDTTIQLYLDPRPGGKTAVTVSHAKLPSAAAIETRRAEWRAALTALAEYVAPRAK
jgi:hypothetical protein